MNKQVRNRDKKIAFLLIAAFAWLFIGSLILFHQEHVLGKHIKLNSHLFISPKSKDKKDHTLSLQNSLLTIVENGTAAGIVSNFDYYNPVRISFELLAKEFASFLINDALLAQVPLRAPPVHSN